MHLEYENYAGLGMDDLHLEHEHHSGSGMDAPVTVCAWNTRDIMPQILTVLTFLKISLTARPFTSAVAKNMHCSVSA